MRDLLGHCNCPFLETTLSAPLLPQFRLLPGYPRAANRRKLVQLDLKMQQHNRVGPSWR